jgi:hypothetical protein
MNEIHSVVLKLKNTAMKRVGQAIYLPQVQYTQGCEISKINKKNLRVLFWWEGRTIQYLVPGTENFIYGQALHNNISFEVCMERKKSEFVVVVTCRLVGQC